MLIIISIKKDVFCLRRIVYFVVIADFDLSFFNKLDIITSETRKKGIVKKLL